MSEFERLLWIAHLTAGKSLAAERGAADARRKITVALIRHIREIPADMAFYEAGMACKSVGELNMAFVFLNRYLDITEAVEEHEPSSTTLDNSDFANTDIPFDFPLPETQFLADADREKVRDFVLELSMNSSVQQQLNTDELQAVFREVDQVKTAVVQKRVAGHQDDLMQVIAASYSQVM